MTEMLRAAPGRVRDGAGVWLAAPRIRRQGDTANRHYPQPSAPSVPLLLRCQAVGLRRLAPADRADVRREGEKWSARVTTEKAVPPVAWELLVSGVQPFDLTAEPRSRAERVDGRGSDRHDRDGPGCCARGIEGPRNPAEVRERVGAR